MWKCYSDAPAIRLRKLRMDRRAKVVYRHLHMTTALEQVQTACDIIRAHPEERHTLTALAGRVGASPYHLQRTFTRLVGISPRAFAEACRLGQVKTALRKGERVTPAMYDAGYGSSSRLYERADAAFGMTPATYRRGGLGAQIDFTIVASPLGRLLVGATARGVCRVMIGDDDRAMEQELRLEYPQAEIRRNDRILSAAVRGLIAYLRGRSPHPELPLDVRATAFQWRVWRQLRAIPYGETRTYQQVAREIGAPTATRAVARACATNPVALLIPCHRVIRTDGSMGGYRWGIPRKEKLLAQERRRRRT
jgi:AraC family transcriptional regulator of adaptative response/methylated-DNA-[protein]-cysteine methyltransferase